MSGFRTIESPEQQRQLLGIARETSEQFLGVAKREVSKRPVIEGRFGGVFVTFWNNEALRGCVGTFAPTTDINATVQDVTEASLKDPRFASNPINAVELEDLEIEISILSDPEPTDDPASLVPGKHGIVVRRGTRSGCFLPKVAAERGWSAEEYLSNCCAMKAGLAADAWKQPDTDVLLFEAEVFCESQFP